MECSKNSAYHTSVDESAWKLAQHFFIDYTFLKMFQFYHGQKRPLLVSTFRQFHQWFCNDKFTVIRIIQFAIQRNSCFKSFLLGRVSEEKRAPIKNHYIDGIRWKRRFGEVLVQPVHFSRWKRRVRWARRAYITISIIVLILKHIQCNVRYLIIIKDEWA